MCTMEVWSVLASRLPMRNWNFEVDWELVVPYGASRLPMRNWNLIRVCTLSLVRLGLPDYLWGIETDLDPLDVLHLFPLPAYLWGIETRLPQSCCIQLFRFQTTYEELKLWTTSGTFPAFSFQTTYEELKLVIFRTSATQLWLPDYLWGIETRIWWTVWRHRCASRLPMRNWNTVH